MTNGMIKAKNDMYGVKERKIPVVEVEPIKSEPLEMGFERRLLEEVKAAVFLAKQFPRDEAAAEKKILELCKRQKFAETALYSIPRGNERAVGPTIRFAEALARAWGNIQYSVIELETESGISKMLAYAWDVEANTKSTRQFDVTMQRYTKFGNKDLVSYQDCYEMRASYGARFLRGCILNLIPNDIIEEAIEQINNTLNGNISDLEKTKMKAVEFWQNEMGIYRDELEKYLNLSYEMWDKKEINMLRFTYNTIKTGQATLKEIFGIKEKAILPEERPTTKQMQELLRMGNNKNIDAQKRAKELFGVVSLLTLNMTQYEMLYKSIERS